MLVVQTGSWKLRACPLSLCADIWFINESIYSRKLTQFVKKDTVKCSVSFWYGYQHMKYQYTNARPTELEWLFIPNIELKKV